MHLLRYYFAILLVCVLCVNLTACSSSDDGNDLPPVTDVKQAVGTWMCIESVDNYRGQSSQGLMVGKQVTIKSDGTFTSTSSSFGYSGTYTMSGSTITAKSSAGTFLVTVYLSGDTMKWNGTASNGVTFEYTFKRES